MEPIKNGKATKPCPNDASETKATKKDKETSVTKSPNHFSKKVSLHILNNILLRGDEFLFSKAKLS